MRYLRIWLFLSTLIITSHVYANDNASLEDIFDSLYSPQGFMADHFVDFLLNNKLQLNDKRTIKLLENLPSRELQIIINTVFAKHGLTFKKRELMEYFQHKPWYVPKSSEVVLSADEERIISVVKSIENGEGVKFADFRNLFIPLTLPFTYGTDLKRNELNTMMLRKYLNNRRDVYLPYFAIGEIFKNNDYVVFLYEMSSVETVIYIATFSLNGELISDKDLLIIGGDLSSYTDGDVFVDKNLTIHVSINESYIGENGKYIVEKKREKYLVDKRGVIRKIK